jgi:hypothetical protein
MKSLLNFTPVFAPGNPGEGSLDFGAYPNFDTHKLYAVINVTRNSPIYIPGAPNLGASNTQVAKIFLSADTSTHSATDVINIYYESSNTKLEANAAQESGGNLERLVDLQEKILIEIRITNILLKEGLNIREELDTIREFERLQIE